MIGVSRMDDVIAVAVEDDGRDKQILVFGSVRSFTRRRSALSHGGECGKKVVSGPTGQT